MDVEELFRRHGSERDQLADATSASDLYTRQYGAELALWETRLLHQFKEKHTSRLFRYSGFAPLTAKSFIVPQTANLPILPP